MKETIFERAALYAKALTLISMMLLIFCGAGAGEVIAPEDVQRIKASYWADISPDGRWVAYSVYTQRQVDEDPGGAYNELYLVSVRTGEIRPFITGKVNINHPRFSPDGSKIAFTAKRGEKAKTQVWMIPIDGGESIQVTKSKTNVSTFRWHPGGKKIAFVAATPKSDIEKELDEKGYGFVFFKENLKHRNLYITGISREGGEDDARQLTEGITVWDFEFDPSGEKVAIGASPLNLIDHRYMFRKIYIVDLATKERTRLTDNPGKLGNYNFSPDGSRMVYTAASERKDHAVSQVYVIDLDGGTPTNLTEPGFRGHVSWAGWKDNKTVLYRAGEGVWPTLSTVSAGGGSRKVILDSSKTGIVFNAFSFTKDFEHFVLVGSSPNIPADIFYWRQGKKNLEKLTDLNPWISDLELGRQEVIRYRARDGLEIEGLLVYPVGYAGEERYPLIVGVHGGPESHYSNGWLTRYFNPAQVLAGKGYVVFFPNYRASTGYGVEFALEGYMDAAGKEFDDIADGIEHLVSIGVADPERVGLGGGSYGGFAAAWFATYYTKYVKAVCMFVGISDLISKRGTTDIPYEELYVHSGEKLEKTWERSLERSPIYWAHQSRTAVLILGGKSDSRVHPSQSLEFYTRLMMNDHPATRMVQYPGEGHGNRKQPGRIDVLHRQLQWYDWYVKDARPFDGPMPPLDITEAYGLELENKEEK